MVILCGYLKLGFGMNVTQLAIKEILIDIIQYSYLRQIEYIFDALSGVDDDTVVYEVGRQIAFSFDYNEIPMFVGGMSREHLLLWGSFYRNHEVLLYSDLMWWASDDEMYDMCDDIGIEEVGDDARYNACHDAANSLYWELEETVNDENRTFIKYMDSDLFLGNRVPVPDIGMDLRQYIDRV